MNRNHYRRLRAVIIIFVSALVALGVTQNSFFLSLAGILTGIIFLVMVRSKARIRTDERERTIQEKAARMTYAIVAPTLGIAALLLLIPSKSGVSVFSKGEWTYIESLGMVFAYLALFMIAIYAISYHFFNRKYGGGGNDE